MLTLYTAIRYTVMPHTTQPLRVLVVKKLGIVSDYNIVAAFQSNDPKGIALQGGVCDALTGEPVCFAPFIIVTGILCNVLGTV